MVHLGFGIGSRDSAFFLADRLRLKFAGLRERLLSSKISNLRVIQSFIGKCSHVRLLFPASSLFTLRCRRLEPTLGSESSPLPPEVEVAFWSFDSFTQPIPFRLQQLLSLRLSTDASGFGWGAIVSLPSGSTEIRVYWSLKLF